MSRHFVHNRRAGARGGAAAFATRNQGYQSAKKVWLCQSCWSLNFPKRDGAEDKPAKPAHCINRACGAPSKDFLIFDSSGEGQRFIWLMREQRYANIRGLQHHPRYPLCVPDPHGTPRKFAYYEADSTYEAPDDTGQWRQVVEDFKPRDPKAQDPVFKLKRRAFELQYGIPISIVTK